MTTYKLVWDDFCAWYLEMIKPEFVDGKSMPIDKETYTATINFFEKLLKVLHPFMPFITEEIWHLIGERKEKDCIIVAEWPEFNGFNSEEISLGDSVKEIISNIRLIRQQKQISPKQKLQLYCKSNPQAIAYKYDSLL